MIGMDPYRVLGVSRGASADEIRQAYFTMVRQHPPERDPDAFKRIRDAYERLKSLEKRVESDVFLMKELAPEFEPPPAFAQVKPAFSPAAALIWVEERRSDVYRRDFPEDLLEIELPG